MEPRSLRNTFSKRNICRGGAKAIRETSAEAEQRQWENHPQKSSIDDGSPHTQPCLHPKTCARRPVLCQGRHIRLSKRSCAPAPCQEDWPAVLQAHTPRTLSVTRRQPQGKPWAYLARERLSLLQVLAVICCALRILAPRLLPDLPCALPVRSQVQGRLCGDGLVVHQVFVPAGGDAGRLHGSGAGLEARAFPALALEALRRTNTDAPQTSCNCSSTISLKLQFHRRSVTVVPPAVCTCTSTIIT